ncbi:MAG: hypothetical protein FWB72_01965 [Firmicutes bacterium]|nr:hypothetical protein [Bacillota bacterium]
MFKKLSLPPGVELDTAQMQEIVGGSSEWSNVVRDSIKRFENAIATGEKPDWSKTVSVARVNSGEVHVFTRIQPSGSTFMNPSRTGLFVTRVNYARGEIIRAAEYESGVRLWHYYRGAIIDN